MFSARLGSATHVLRLFENVDLLCALPSMKPNQSQKEPFLSKSNWNADLVVPLSKQTLWGVI